MKTLAVNEIPLTASLLLAQKEVLNTELSRLTNILNSAPKGAMGLTLDEAKTPEWRKAKTDYNKAWNEFRSINQQLNKLRKPSHREVINGKLTTIYKYK